MVVGHIEGAILYQMGDLKKAKETLEQGLALYKEERRDAFIANYGQDPAVFCRNWLSICYWMLGQPDRAKQTALDAVHHAERFKHPFTQVFALFCIVQVALFRQDEAAIKTYAEQLFQQATENDFAFFIPFSIIAKGKAVSKQDCKEGLALMERGIETYGGPIQKETFTAHFIRTLIDCGFYEKALQVTKDTLASTQQTQNKVFDAGLLALKAEALGKQGMIAEADSLFKEAIERANHQGAKMLELRSALAYSNFLKASGNVGKAAEVLGNSLSWFDRDLGDLDVQEAFQTFDTLQTVA